MSEQFRQFLLAHKWTILSVLAGLVIVILIFTINFWRTLLLLAIVALCFLIGTLLDQGGTQRVKAFFRELFTRG